MHMCYLKETHFRSRNRDRLRVEGWKKVFHANENQKTARVAIIISDKKDFKMKTVIRHKEGHYITTKGSIQEDTIIVNIHAPS